MIFYRPIKKKASSLNSAIIQIVLVALLLILFVGAVSSKVNSRGVKQQVVEKQVALLIDSGVSGMTFEIKKVNVNGIISSLEIDNGYVKARVSGLSSVKGYPFFTKYLVKVVEEEDKFLVILYDK